MGPMRSLHLSVCLSDQGVIRTKETFYVTHTARCLTYSSCPALIHFLSMVLSMVHK